MAADRWAESPESGVGRGICAGTEVHRRAGVTGRWFVPGIRFGGDQGQTPHDVRQKGKMPAAVCVHASISNLITLMRAPVGGTGGPVEGDSSSLSDLATGATA